MRDLVVCFQRHGIVVIRMIAPNDDPQVMPVDHTR